MASGVYTSWKTGIMNKTIDMEADTFKCCLLNNSHAFTAANDAYADISSNELGATGNYTVGGVTMTNPTVSEDGTAGKWTADNCQWTTATFTAYHAAIYDTTVSNQLVCSIDFGGAEQVTSGTFTISWDSTGIVRLT